MNAEELTRIISELIGEAPQGLEWLGYFFSWLLVFFGLFAVLFIIVKFIKLFDRN